MDEPNLDVDEDSENKFTQRKETDSDVVRVVTIHGSKGLQYPVVYLPESQFGPGAQKTVAFREKISNDPNAGKGCFFLWMKPRRIRLKTSRKAFVLSMSR